MEQPTVQMNDMILVSVDDHGGGKQPSDDARGYCTIGDIMKPLAHAISTPFDGAGARSAADR
jgi:hypothetical protein